MTVLLAFLALIAVVLPLAALYFIIKCAVRQGTYEALWRFFDEKENPDNYTN